MVIMETHSGNNSVQGPEASGWNSSTSYLGNLEDLKMDSNFAMLMCSLVLAVTWVVYIMYYNSRVIAYIITKTVNRFFIKEGYLVIGNLLLNIIVFFLKLPINRFFIAERVIWKNHVPGFCLHYSWLHHSGAGWLSDFQMVAFLRPQGC